MSYIAALYPFLIPLIISLVSTGLANSLSSGLFKAKTLLRNYVFVLLTVYAMYVAVPVLNRFMFGEKVQYLGAYGVIERLVFVAAIFTILVWLFFKSTFSDRPFTSKLIFTASNVVLIVGLWELRLLIH